ncbi:hypothetical protein BH11VER1_BH11VER1_16610 [soil metagenome]
MHSSLSPNLPSFVQTDRCSLGRKLRQGLRKSVQLLILPLAIGALQQSVQAQTSAGTDPVGFVSITALGNSDTRFSAPLHRPTNYQGVVGSVSGNVVTVQGTPAWTTVPQQWVYTVGSQANTYYVEFGSGAKEGVYYSVIANGTNTLTLDLSSDTIEGSVISGDTVRIIPYWTLAALFPGQAGITGTSSIFGAGSCTKIFATDATAVGVNLGATQTYYYYTGATNGGPGWRQIGGGFTNIKNDSILLQDTHFIIRQDGVPTSVITVSGVVPMNDKKTVIGTLAANTTQDNFVALEIPVPMTLAQSSLFQSGAFTGTASIFGNACDQLLVFNDTLVGTNKSASGTYYYYTGAANGGPGWRQIGGGFSTIRDNDVVFQPGSGYIIRKQATVTPVGVVWSTPLTY